MPGSIRYSAAVLKPSSSSKYLLKPGKICQQTAADVVIYRPLHIPNNFLEPPCCLIETAQKWLALPGKNDRMHQFPVQTILPKVQMTRHVPPKTLPRDVEVDRRRRQYAEKDLQQMLDEADLSNQDLMPTEEQYYVMSEKTFKHFLPLSFFDDSTYDCHSEEGWLKLGVVDGEQFPLPAKAFLPVSQGSLDYSWQFAAVSSYDETVSLWTAMALMDECVYQIPKIQIMFLAEDSHKFVERLQKAVNTRNDAESLLMMEVIVDCVLLQNLRDKSFSSYGRITKLLDAVKSPDPVFRESIRTEVCLVFEHLMACYEFDKFVKMMPKEFPAFTGNLIKNALPKAFPSILSAGERQMIKEHKLNMKDLRYNVLKTTLYYIAAGIEAMMNVVVECEYIETLSIFVCHFAKAIPLNDFLQTQQQQSNHVSSYLKNFWPVKVSNGICLVLRPNGKGWLDISLNNWSVYQMCKIIRFVLQVKFRMQESMQVLLEKSINNFSHLLTEPCIQFLELPDDYTWPPNDFINSDFPYPKPIFSMIVGISEDEKTFYSTAPEEFEPAITEVFKKALEKTSGVRCIDAETMTHLHFAPNLYILTVELIENLFMHWNDLMGQCYHKAVIPLNAYIKLYERFIPFYVLTVNDFMFRYEDSNPSSAQVKHDILEHKRQKEELREILPATITIGPFLVIVDPIKQYMIKKHIEIVKRLFEYYVQRMWTINEELLDQCLHIYNKISERPQSIEHLYEIRDFALTVPDLVEQLKADIQIMWLEYEILDSFFYNLSDSQFSMKWEVYAWPFNIMQRLSTLREEQKIDIDDFRRMHLSECIGFEERLESLNEEIQAFSLQFDVAKVVEISVDVKKTWKLIMEMQKLGNILKFRQTLFEMEELSLGFLDSIIESFTPYRNLWNACSDFIKLEDATEGNPIAQTDLPDVWAAITELRNSLKDSYNVFSEKPEIQDVATAFLQRLDDFVPVYHCITWLRNENWLFMHWQELAIRSGMEIKYSVAMNFLYLRRKGVMEHLELVHEISVKAEEEAESIRLAWEEEERRKEEELMALLRRKAMRKCRTDIV